MTTINTRLEHGRWYSLSLSEQLGNIGSEVGRAISWQKKGDRQARDRALERGLKLFDFTVEDPRWGKRRHEVLRAREVVCDFFYGDNVYRSTPESLDRYFFQFAVAARLNR